VLIDDQMEWLQRTVGLPNGFNVRNLLWHGYYAADRIPLCFLFFVERSIAGTLLLIKEKISSGMQITIRSLLSYDPTSVHLKYHDMDHATSCAIEGLFHIHACRYQPFHALNGADLLSLLNIIINIMM
jgi:hypothetical protein